MQFVTFRDTSGDAVGIVDGDTLIAISDLVAGAPADMIGVIAAGDALQKKLATSLASAPGEIRRKLDSVELRLPIEKPGKFVCLGLNYALHAKEWGVPLPDYPSLFMRAHTSLVAPNAPILRPKVSTQLDYECELTIVIGKGGRDIAEEDALSHVFGYTVFNDVSVRDFQNRTTQWTAGKNFDGTGPLGPGVVTADALPPQADGLGIRTRLNGEVMQDSNTSDMVFKTAQTVAILSQIMTLEPGDMIATGTPSGVGYVRKPPVWLKAGDVVEVEIDGIGTLRNPVLEAR